MEGVQTGAIVAVALAIALGLVEVVKALVSRIGNGKKTGQKESPQDIAEVKAAIAAVHQQVQDPDGVPLSYYAKQQIHIARAELKRIEGIAANQERSAAIQERSVELLTRLEARMESLEKKAS